MSIISISRPDASTSMYKHFASLLSTYVVNQNIAKEDAEIPIETIYKLLEMYRHDAYKDENRRGTLAIRSAGRLSRISKPQPWQTHIVKALDQAKISAYGENTPKEAVVVELESVLMNLARNQQSESAHKDHASKFFTSLEAALG